MTDHRRARIGATALCLGFAVLYFIILLTALHAVGTDADLYYSEQMKAGILPASGISEEALRKLDAGLSDYLRGTERQAEMGGTVCPVIEVFGAEQPAFHEKEMTHLADCAALFDLLRNVRSRLIPWAVLLIVGGAYLLQDRRRARLGAWLSPLILLVPLGAFALYAALNFDAAFTLFHRVLFRNDLWLLDPRTDLLIRICPASMFLHMGVRIGAYSLIGILAVSAAATALTFIWPKRKEDNSWNNRDMRGGSAQKRITFGRTDMR